MLKSVEKEHLNWKKEDEWYSRHSTLTEKTATLQPRSQGLFPKPGKRTRKRGWVTLVNLTLTQPLSGPGGSSRGRLEREYIWWFERRRVKKVYWHFLFWIKILWNIWSFNLSRWLKSSSVLTIPHAYSAKGLFLFIFHQIFSLLRDWCKRVTWLNIPQIKLGNIPFVFLTFQSYTCCEKHLKSLKDS